MARGRAGRSDAVFRQFAARSPLPRGARTTSAGSARPARFDHQWLVRAVIEVHSGGHALAPNLLLVAGKRCRVTARGAGFKRLRSEFTGCGYELGIEPRLPETLLLKALRPTGPRLASVREGSRPACGRSGGAGGTASARVGSPVRWSSSTGRLLGSCRVAAGRAGSTLQTVLR